MSQLKAWFQEAKGKNRMWKCNVGGTTWMLFGNVSDPNQYTSPLAALSMKFGGTGWTLRYGGFGEGATGTIDLPASEETPFDLAEAMYDLVN